MPQMSRNELLQAIRDGQITTRSEVSENLAPGQEPITTDEALRAAVTGFCTMLRAGEIGKAETINRYFFACRNGMIWSTDEVRQAIQEGYCRLVAEGADPERMAAQWERSYEFVSRVAEPGFFESPTVIAARDSGVESRLRYGDWVDAPKRIDSRLLMNGKKKHPVEYYSDRNPGIQELLRAELRGENADYVRQPRFRDAAKAGLIKNESQRLVSFDDRFDIEQHVVDMYGIEEGFLDSPEMRAAKDASLRQQWQRGERQKKQDEENKSPLQKLVGRLRK